jgi:hypothetical protein
VGIKVSSRYQTGTATAGRMRVQAGFNAGNTVAIGSVTKVGIDGSIRCDTAGLNGSQSAVSFGDVLLNPGTYVAYPVVTRAAGDPSDFASAFNILVADLGNV